MQNPIVHDGERAWLEKVVDDLLDDDLKLVYADWLEERGDARATFLRDFVAATKSMDVGAFPDPDPGFAVWADLIGFEIVRAIAHHACPDFRETALRLARPALRMSPTPGTDDRIAIGAHKLFGRPDLPTGVAWPTGNDCPATYNDDTAGRTDLAGFCGQIDLDAIAHTFAARDLPSSGLLSIFCFQDIENDQPDVIGARVLHVPNANDLHRREPAEELGEGNAIDDVFELAFEETLDLPESYDGPWEEELSNESWHGVLQDVRERNFANVLGYARSTSGGDPTRNRQSRHLIVLDNPAGCRLHIHIHEDDLAKANFDAVELRFVDFD